MKTTKKRCAGCHRWLPLRCFGEHADRSDGKRSNCKACENYAQRRGRGYDEPPRAPQRDLAASWL